MKDIRIAAVVCRCPVGQVNTTWRGPGTGPCGPERRAPPWSAFPELNLTGYSNRSEIADHAISAHGSEIDALIRLALISKSLCWWGLLKKPTMEGFLPATWRSPRRAGPVSTGNSIWPRRKRIISAPVKPCRCSTGRGSVRHSVVLRCPFPRAFHTDGRGRCDMIFIPHASPRGQAVDKHQSWMRHLPARAFDNGLFVVACNQRGNNENGLVFPGNAVAFSPSGEIMETRLSGTRGNAGGRLDGRAAPACPQPSHALFLAQPATRALHPNADADRP
jgi:hypothetical protein